MMSASVDKPEVIRSKTFESACVGRYGVYLESSKSLETCPCRSAIVRGSCSGPGSGSRSGSGESAAGLVVSLCF